MEGGEAVGLGRETEEERVAASLAAQVGGVREGGVRGADEVGLGR